MNRPKGIIHIPGTSSGDTPSGRTAAVPGAGRRLPAGRWIWLALSVVLLVWLLGAPEHTLANRRLGVLFVTVLNFVAALAIQHSARRPDLPHEMRKGLRWVAAGVALSGFGGLYVLVQALVAPKNQEPFNLADLMFLASYPAILVGLFCMPRVKRVSISIGRLLVDSAVFMTGVGLPLWFFAVQPGLATASGYEAAMDVAYPLVTFAGITALNIVLLTRAPLPSRGAFRLLVGAISVSWLADLLYLLDSVQGFVARGPINWTNVFNTASICLFLLAAWRVEKDGLAGPQAVHPAASSPLPMATIVVVSAWLVVFTVRGHPAPEAILRISWSLAVLFVILAAREIYFIRDGTRWMAVEVERESRARSDVLVRHSSDVLMVVDSKLTIRFASPAAVSALGKPADALTGQLLLGLVHPDDIAKGSEFLDRVLRAPGTPQTLAWRLRRADGTYRNFETVGTNVMHESAVEGLVINSRDITDRVSLEEKLRQSQKLEAIGQLVGGIAHNFNNILTSTMMRLSFLRQNPSLPGDVITEIEALDKEARRTADLTKKLVLFGQQQFLKKEPLSLRDSMARLQPEITRLLGKGIQLYVTGGTSPEWVDADAGLVDQVILSICSNARDAMPQGGCLIIEVSGVDHAPLPAAPEGDGRQGAFGRISFQDTGCGMDTSVVQRLFEPFFTTKGGHGGIGLGLAAVHGIVKQHRGWMEVESSPGHGSTFRVFLPRAPEPSVA